jgi:hypothetical protein
MDSSEKNYSVIYGDLKILYHNFLKPHTHPLFWKTKVVENVIIYCQLAPLNNRGGGVKKVHVVVNR